MAYDKLRLKVADYGCILLVNMPTAARFDTISEVILQLDMESI